MSTSLIERYTNSDFSPLSEGQRTAVKAHREKIKKADKTPPEGWTIRTDPYLFSTINTLLLWKDFNQAATTFQSVAAKWVGPIFENRRMIRTNLVNARKVSSIFKYMATEKPEMYDLISNRLVQLLNEIATAGTYNEQEIKLIISKFIMHSLVYFEYIKLEFVIPNH